MRFRILSEYNKMAKQNNLATIAIEINGVLQNIEDIETEAHHTVPNNTFPINLQTMQSAQAPVVPKLEPQEMNNDALSTDMAEQVSDNENYDVEATVNEVAVEEQSDYSTSVSKTTNSGFIIKEFIPISGEIIKHEPMGYSENEEYIENIIDVEDVEEMNADGKYIKHNMTVWTKTVRKNPNGPLEVKWVKSALYLIFS